MQIIPSGDNLQEKLSPIFYKNEKNISICRLLKSLPSMLSGKVP